MTIIHSRCHGGDANRWESYDKVETCINPPCDLNDNGHPCLPCSELAQIEAKIEELHSRLKDLHKNHRALCSKRNSFHKCLVTRLPYEIASDILVQVCLPDIRALCDKDLHPEITGMPNHHLPMMLASICHPWRKLVFSIPKLWSSFSIKAHEPDFSHINRHLQLSGPRSPLFIRLQSPANAIFPGFQSHNAMALVKENLHRIAYLCISFSRSYISAFASVRAASPDNALLLEEFHIHALDFGSRKDTPYLKLCTNPPRPRKVFISSYDLSQVHLDWSCVSQMIYDPVYGMTFEELCGLLSQAKSLVEFKLSGIHELATFRSGKMIIHNSIRNFTLTGKPASTQAIFMHTTMPSLESLTSSCCDQAFNGLSTFIQRSACPLTSLDLSFTVLAPARQLIRALEHTPMLQDLSLSIDLVSGDQPMRPILSCLKGGTQNSSDAIILPHLRKFTYSGVLDIPLGFFLEIMESRDVMPPSTQHRVRPLQEMVVCARSRWLELDRGVPGTGRTPIVTQGDLQRILDLRVARQTISVSLLEDSRQKPVDLVEEAMETYGFDGKN